MSSLGPPIALQRALAESLTTGSFIDTKFYVFSRRRLSRAMIDKPRALYANSSVLKERSTYFATMLSSGFSETASKNIADDFPENETPYVDDYDYYTDSDLEDDVEEDDCHSDSSEFVEEKEVPLRSEVSGEIADLARSGPVIIVKDAAFLTFQAVLGFLHTGDIEFGRFGLIGSAVQDQDDDFPRPSPKSVYRLADKFGLEDLKTLAYNNIRMNISSCDIVNELFSNFTSWYSEIRELEIRECSRAIRSGSADAIRKRLMIKLDGFGHGDFSHSSESVVALAKALSSTMPDTTVIRNTTSVPLTPRPPYWSDLRKAIMNSLRSGRFIDAKIHAYSTWSGFENIAQPIPLYFSKMALDNCYEKLSNLILGLMPTTRKKIESEYESDSDLDEDEPSVHDLSNNVGTEATEQTLPIQIPATPHHSIINHMPQGAMVDPGFLIHVGAFKTWKSVLYYVYTGDVNFAPLESQGSEPGVKDIHGHHHTFAIPPCSPKSVYIIAEQLGLQELRELAYDDIVSKIGPDNAVEETFSTFSSLRPRLLQIGKQAFLAHRADANVLELLSDKVHAIAGHDSHHSEALKSIFAGLIDKVTKSGCSPSHTWTYSNQTGKCPEYVGEEEEPAPVETKSSKVCEKGKKKKKRV